MCGLLAGSMNLSQEKINKSLDYLNSRGPDSKNVYIGNGIFIAHTLLSIFSKNATNAIQPIKSFNGTLIGAVNGEIYNYAILKKELESRGYILNGGTDSEVLINTIECFGIDYINKINGEFAFVIYDLLSKKWIAGVDRHGTKPLKYYLDKNNFFIGSTISAIKTLGVDLSIDVSSCLHSLALQILPKNKTLFDGIYTVPPGSYITVDKDNNLVSVEWYKPLVENRLVDYSEIEHAIEGAILRRVPSNHKLGLVLSGGIDSSIVRYYLFKNNIDVETYSIDFQPDRYSERGEITQFCNRHNFNTNYLTIDSKKLAQSFRSAVINSENLCINPHIAAKLLVNQHMKNRGIKVCLTGDGADEFFYGYEHFNSGNDYQFLLNSITLGEKNLHLINTDLQEKFKSIQNFKIGSKSAQQIYLEHWLPQYGVGMLGDSQSANIGQEHRYPFLDNEVVDLTLSYKNFKQLNYPSKMILRNLVSKWDQQKSTVPKKPFTAPHLTVDYNPLFEEYVLDSSKMLNLNLYNTKYLKDYIKLLNGGTYSTVILCQILSLGILIKDLSC